MPLWPGPDRKFTPVTRIWIESAEDRLDREQLEGRSPGQIAHDREQIQRNRLRSDTARWIEERARREEDERREEEQRAWWLEVDPDGYYGNLLIGLVDQLSEIEQDIARVIANARAAGISWDVIAGCLDVSRQAASKRYGPGGPGSYVQRRRQRRTTKER